MTVVSKWAKCDLTNESILFLPWVKGRDGVNKPPFRQDVAQLSLELASTAYDLKVDDWRKAGWRDISYQVDNKLLTGESANGGDGTLMKGALSGYLQLMTRAKLKQVDPISQIRGALRQRKKSDTCKAVVMLRKADNGRYGVAIGFMGTGKRLYDWISNFRMNRQEEMHEGFLQLTQEFENNCDTISFPQTATELGLESLSLSDIIKECKQKDSRFFLWMAGHSQGSAVMQIFTYHLIQKGVLPANILGYGFASPTVAYDLNDISTLDFPLYHFINSDDAIPRVGAKRHLGRCYLFPMQNDVRAICYRAAWGNESFVECLRVTACIQDTRSGLICLIALLRVIGALSDAEAQTILSGMMGRFIPDKLLAALGGRMDQLTEKLARKSERTYLHLLEEKTLPTEEIRHIQTKLADMINRYGAKEFVQSLMSALAMPHHLRGDDEVHGMAPYQYFVTVGFDALREGEGIGQTSIIPVFVKKNAQTSAHRKVRQPLSRFTRLSGLRAQRENKEPLCQPTNR